MADVETKVDETVEVAEGATEAKADKAKKSVDVNKVVDSVKSGVKTGNKKLTAFFTGNAKRSKLVLLAIMIVEALLAFGAGFLNFLIAAVCVVVGFVGLNAAMTDEAKAEEAEKTDVE